MIRMIVVIVLFTFAISGISAQSFGIRAGLNYTSFSGPFGRLQLKSNGKTDVCI